MVSLRAVVHIGPMKTGTTAFAAACTQADRAGLMPPGMLYPTGALWFDDDRTVVKHHQMNAAARSAAAAGQAGARPAIAADEVDRALAACAVEARRREVDGSATVVFVAEGLSLQKNPQGLTKQLRRYADEVDYVLVARGQPRAVGSIVAHGVKDVAAVDRRYLDAARYLARPARARRFDYARIVKGWRHEGATLHILPFDESAPGTMTLTDSIFDQIGLPRVGVSESVAGKRTHPSFSERGLQELARVKRRWSSVLWVPGAEKLYRTVFSQVWNRHHDDARDGIVERWRLSPRDEQTVAEAYALSNRRFSELLGEQAHSPQWREWFSAVGVTVDRVADEKRV